MRQRLLQAPPPEGGPSLPGFSAPATATKSSTTEGAGRALSAKNQRPTQRQLLGGTTTTATALASCCRTTNSSSYGFLAGPGGCGVGGCGGSPVVTMIGSLLVVVDRLPDDDPPQDISHLAAAAAAAAADDEVTDEEEEDSDRDDCQRSPGRSSTSSSSSSSSSSLAGRQGLAKWRAAPWLGLETRAGGGGGGRGGGPRPQPLASHAGQEGRGGTYILACSSSSPWEADPTIRRQMSAEHAALIMGDGESGGNSGGSGRHYRRLGEDRKGFFEHLRPRPLFKSTIRVAIMQATQVSTQYINDQVKADMDRDELVAKGKLSRPDARADAAQWAEREWRRRWEAFPHRLFVALGKYHAILMAMRMYEDLASRFVSDVTLDRLTMDTFDAAKRLSKEERKSGPALASAMFSTCWRGNLISYVADYSVHQVILLFGYYVYVRDQRRQRQLKLLQQQQTHLPDEDEEEDEDERALRVGTLLLSAVKNSTLLALSRAVGLFFSSLGGAVGSLFAPAWGSLGGAQLGDALALAASDEFIGPGAPLL